MEMDCELERREEMESQTQMREDVAWSCSLPFPVPRNSDELQSRSFQTKSNDSYKRHDGALLVWVTNLELLHLSLVILPATDKFEDCPVTIC